MPLPNPNLFALFPLAEYLFDKTTGAPLAGGQVAFYSDSQWPTLKPIYQVTEQPPHSGNLVYSQLQNPMTLDGLGQYVDEVGNSIIPFLYPYLGAPTDSVPQAVELYYIEVYDANGVLQFTRSAWPPNQPDLGETISDEEQSENILVNPQFNEVYFGGAGSLTGIPGTDGSYAYSVSGTDTYTTIAPGWMLLTSGTDTITVQQISISGSNVSPSGAPCGLSISGGSSLTSISLVQRVLNSPRILANSYIAGYFEVKSNTGSEQGPFIFTYVPSGTGDTELICQGVSSIGSNFTAITGASQFIPAANSDGYSGYIEFQLAMPVGCNVTVTSFQAISTPSSSNTNLSFIQISTPQQKSQLFSYWQDALNYKPIPSFLVGWDFPLNPAQSMVTDNSNASLHNPITFGADNLSGYIWDQTILFQGTNASIDVSRSSTTNGLTLTMASSATTSTSAIIQYLPANVAREMLSQNLSVKIQALNTGASIPCTVSLYYTVDTDLPQLEAIPNGTSYSLVSAVSSVGVPTIGGGGNYGTWVQVPRNGLKDPATFTVSDAVLPDYFFSGFNFGSTTGSTTATYIAIVIGIGEMTYNVSANQSITFNYVSCVPGDIPTRPAPQQPNDVLRQCRYYYETNYDVGVALGATSAKSTAVIYCVPQYVSAGGSGSSLTVSSYSAPIWLNFLEAKREAPASTNITFYNPATGVKGAVLTFIAANGSQLSGSPSTATFSSFWAFQFAGLNSAVYFSNSASPVFTSGLTALPIVGIYAGIEAMYVVDCRLGILL